jgi:hypothetical protein
MFLREDDVTDRRACKAHFAATWLVANDDIHSLNEVDEVCPPHSPTIVILQRPFMSN